VLGDAELCADIAGFVAELAPASGRTSLAQTLLKLTTPGVPDLYQGTELWDLSLVDPDNRRPVDYSLRRKLLESVSENTPPEKILARADDGLPKLWLVHRALCLRQDRPEWFGPKASYKPLKVDEDAGLAFQRGKNVVVVVPRLTYRHAARWNVLRAHLPAGKWRNLLTGETIEGGATALYDLFTRFPVALFIREEA
jgi:(1->4)-alpha-D-glucan 1-alpha-D-glucosylmutase